MYEGGESISDGDVEGGGGVGGDDVYRGSAKPVLCCDNYLSQEQMITQRVNLLVEVSSGEFTRELNKEPLLN